MPDRPVRILSIGVAVVDFVFHVKHFPTRPDKYRASKGAMTGGGGGANAAVAISRLGGEAWLGARLGADDLAETIRAGLEGERVRTELVRRFDGHRSSFSSVLVDEAAERLIVNYRDETLPRDAGWLDDALGTTSFDGVLADTRWPKGALAAMRYARRAGIPGVLDAEAPVHEAIDAVSTASHVVFSAQGLRDYCGLDADHPDLLEPLRRADGELDGIVGVTDGPDGVRWLEEGELHHVRPPRLSASITDTLGAGDVWHGALALALAEAQSLAAAMRFATAAATLKCVGATGRDGAPGREEVERILRDSGFRD